jgi:hypothetical protein
MGEHKHGHSTAALLKAALDHWVATRDALLGVHALGLTEDERLLPGIEFVRDWLFEHAPCGNGPLERAIRARIEEAAHADDEVSR